MSRQPMITAAREAAERGRFDEAWSLLEVHREALADDPALAWAWLVLAEQDPGRQGAARSDLEAILTAWPDRPELVLNAVEQLLAPVDGRPADEPIPGDDPTGPARRALASCLDMLQERAPEQLRDPEVGGYLWNSLGNALRLAGPDHDEAAEAAYRNALVVDPERGWWRFNQGLLYKQRGRWNEGVEAFRRAREGVGEQQPVLWNLAICATGAGEGAIAAEAWQALGFEATVDDQGMARVADLGEVIVRLSSAGIGAAHPGAVEPDYEHVWVRPCSPCHGEVLSPTLYNVGIDAGDWVLWDGAPVGYRELDGVRVPRFPLLQRLAPGTAQTFPFVARQRSRGELAALNETLPEALQLYVFSEQMQFLCKECIRTGGSHADHPPPAPAAGPEIVYGKLVLAPDREVDTPASAIARLESVLRDAPGLALAVPALYRAARDEASAASQEALWRELDRV